MTDTAASAFQGQALRAGILDDSAETAEYLKSLLQEWAGQQKIRLSAETFSSGESFLFHYAEDKNFDVLLLDIEMGELDGVSLAREIRKDNEAVQIIFITGYSEYIADGYDVAALNYLLKPVSREKLFSVLDRAAALVKRNEKTLFLECEGEMVRIPVHEIRYLDVWKNYVTVHAREDYTVRRTLGSLEAELDERFFRLGRSAIVNLAYVKRVTRTSVCLMNDETLPLPRGAYESLNRAIIAMT